SVPTASLKTATSAGRRSATQASSSGSRRSRAGAARRSWLPSSQLPATPPTATTAPSSSSPLREERTQSPIENTKTRKGEGHERESDSSCLSLLCAFVFSPDYQGHIMPIPADYAERVYAGVLGKIIGVYLGRPFEGWSYDKIMAELGEISYYVHEKRGMPLVVTDDDISGTFTFLRALPDYGNTRDLTPAQI